MTPQIPGVIIIVIFFFLLLDNSVTIDNLYRNITPLSRARSGCVHNPALSRASLERCRRASTVHASQSHAHACRVRPTLSWAIERLYRAWQGASVACIMLQSCALSRTHDLHTPSSVVSNRTFYRGQLCCDPKSSITT